MFKANKRALWRLVLTILLLIFAGLFGWAIKLHRDYQSIPSEHLIGNKASNVKALKEKGLPFSFLVIGDAHNSHRARTLIKRALKEGDSSFMIILGDFVMEPDIWAHRFFLAMMVREINPTFPVFLVSGNHDIDYTSTKIKKAERRVTPEIYDSFYGARDFNFVYNNSLFIICGIDAKNPAHYLNYLQDTLSQKGKGKKYIFVFTHFPPKGLTEYIEGLLPKGEEFLSLLETYKVTTCFFGDFHGYWRGQRRGVNLIVSGGGGRLKESQPEWGKFNHLLKITVDENTISEVMIILRREVSSVRGTFKKWIFIHLFPIIENRGWLLYLGSILFLCGGVYSVIILFRYLPGKREIGRK